MKKLFALVATVVALATAGMASGARPMMVDGDGGGTPSVSLWWQSYWAGYVDGHYQEYRCLLGSDGYQVYIIRCETNVIG